MKIIIAITLFGLGAAASVGFADWREIENDQFFLPDPPAQDTWGLEVDELLRRQNLRDESLCAEARAQSIPSFASFFDQRRFLSKKQYRKVKPLMDEALHVGERVATHFKDQHLRLRPYNYDPRVQPCIQPPKANKSYPSSHAAMGQLAACLLAAVLPHKADLILQQGEYVGELRLWAGVHFPSDVKAGQELANALCGRLQKDPSFQRELSNLKKELGDPPRVRATSDIRHQDR